MTYERKRMTRNALQCNRCLSVIESKHRHDFNTCACGDMSIDGGLDYTRILAGKGASFESLTEYE